jgi:hypothetical protein
MNDFNSTLNGFSTLTYDYGSDSYKPGTAVYAMDTSNTFAGNRNPFNPTLVVMDTLDSSSWLADPQKVWISLSFFFRVFADLNRSPTSTT